MAPQLDEVAQELHEANPSVPATAFARFLNECRVWTYPWGVIFAKGNDMHIHVMKANRRRVLFRKELKSVAQEMFTQHEVLKTAVLKDKPESLNFNLRIGWKLVGEDETRWHLEMTEKDFAHVWK